MHKALQVELQDWQRDQEPDTDHEGFYQTSLPTIITQVNMPYTYTVNVDCKWISSVVSCRMMSCILCGFVMWDCNRCWRRMPAWLWWLESPSEIGLYRWDYMRWRTSSTGVHSRRFRTRLFIFSKRQELLASVPPQVSRSSGGIWEGASQGSEQPQAQVLPPLSAGLHQQLHHPQVR